MSGRIPRTFIDDLLVRVDIVDLIDTHVPLKKSGSNFVARCPFHNEKTPSFSVSRNKQFYHCFGCGAGGNAISFLMDYNHLDFVEAVEDLAAFTGLDVPREKVDYNPGQNKDSLEQMYSLLLQVAGCYARQLSKGVTAKDAVEYFKSRGVSGKTARDFLLGYAPDGWHFLAKQFDQKQLIAAGLLGQKDGGKPYDRFRGRVIFPIRDKRGRVTGFGGRVMDDSLPKYLNSPETPVFQKGKEVYGLYELLKNNAKPEKILIVEGYMDVIVLAEYGIKNVVATLGTATSKAHMELLFRFSSELVLSFDGDQAGRQAAWRAIEAGLPCLRDGRQIRIMLLLPGSDPDSLVREEGVDGFSKRISAASALSDFFYEQLSTGLNLANMESRARLVGKAKPYLEMLPGGVFREMMYEKLKAMAKVESLAIFGDNAAISRVEKNRLSQRERYQQSPARTAIALLLQHPELITIAEQKQLNLKGIDFPGVPLLDKIVSRILANPEISLAGLVEGFRGLAEEKFVNVLASLPLLIPDGGIESEFSDSLLRIVEQARDDELEKLLEKEQKEGLSAEERQLLPKLLAGR